MVDLGGYVIILVETKDKKIKLYGEYVVYSHESCFRLGVEGDYLCNDNNHEK